MVLISQKHITNLLPIHYLGLDKAGLGFSHSLNFAQPHRLKVLQIISCSSNVMYKKFLHAIA